MRRRPIVWRPKLAKRSQRTEGGEATQSPRRLFVLVEAFSQEFGIFRFLWILGFSLPRKCALVPNIGVPACPVWLAIVLFSLHSGMYLPTAYSVLSLSCSSISLIRKR